MKCNTIPELEKFLRIQEQALGPDSAEVATTTTRLANLYVNAGRLDDAELLHKRALKIRQNLVGIHKDEILESEQSLASLSLIKTSGHNTRKLDATAEAKSTGSTQPEAFKYGNTAQTSYHSKMKSGEQTAATSSTISSDSIKALTDTALMYEPKGEKSKALLDTIHEAELELDLMKQMLGRNHPSVSDMLTRIADLYCRLRMYGKMEPILIDALHIRELTCGSEHPAIATELKNLARLYIAQERYVLAEPLLKRALALRESAFGRNHMRVADIEEQYAVLLRKMNRDQQAAVLENHVLEIRSSQQAASTSIQIKSINPAIGRLA